jgi:hypothetical protein
LSPLLQGTKKQPRFLAAKNCRQSQASFGRQRRLAKIRLASAARLAARIEAEERIAVDAANSQGARIKRLAGASAYILDHQVLTLKTGIKSETCPIEDERVGTRRAGVAAKYFIFLPCITTQVWYYPIVWRLGA